MSLLALISITLFCGLSFWFVWSDWYEDSYLLRRFTKFSKTGLPEKFNVEGIIKGAKYWIVFDWGSKRYGLYRFFGKEDFEELSGDNVSISWTDKPTFISNNESVKKNKPYRFAFLSFKEKQIHFEFRASGIEEAEKLEHFSKHLNGDQNSANQADLVGSNVIMGTVSEVKAVIEQVATQSGSVQRDEESQCIIYALKALMEEEKITPVANSDRNVALVCDQFRKIYDIASKMKRIKVEKIKKTHLITAYQKYCFERIGSDKTYTNDPLYKLLELEFGSGPINKK